MRVLQEPPTQLQQLSAGPLLLLAQPECTMSHSRFWAPESQIKLLRECRVGLRLPGALIISGMQPSSRHQLAALTGTSEGAPWCWGSGAAWASPGTQHAADPLLSAAQPHSWLLTVLLASRAGGPQHPTAPPSAHQDRARRWQQMLLVIAGRPTAPAWPADFSSTSS